MDHQPDRIPNPPTRIAGQETWTGWWIAPALILLITLVLIVGAVIVAGPGQDGGSAGSGNETISKSAPARE